MKGVPFVGVGAVAVEVVELAAKAVQAFLRIQCLAEGHILGQLLERLVLQSADAVFIIA